MNLSDLFDIIYYDSKIEAKYSPILENFKIDELLITPHDITTKFILVITNNIVINKTYNKLKLEFHNINGNSINNDIIVETLNKLQYIINESTDNDNDNDNDNDIITNKIEQNIKTMLNKTEYLQIHVLIRNYTNDNVKYLTSILLNDNIPITDSFNIHHELFGKFDDDNNYLSNLTYFYQELYSDYNDFESIYEYIDKYDILDTYLITNLSKVRSGFYFNKNDIQFQIILKLIILTNIGDNGNFIKYITYNHFNKNNTIVNYFIDNKKSNIFKSILVKNLNIWCDMCNTSISKSENDMYYHNHDSGDICECCYNIKKKEFYNRIKYIKNRILMIGKQITFKKDLINTKKMLKKRKYPIKKKNYYMLLEKMNKNIIANTSNNERICKICYSELIDDIYVGSECGHCFHKECIQHCDKCQICRADTNFIKLFL